MFRRTLLTGASAVALLGGSAAAQTLLLSGGKLGLDGGPLAVAPGGSPPQPNSLTLNGFSSGTVHVTLSTTNMGSTVGSIVVGMTLGGTFTGTPTLGGANASSFSISGSGPTTTLKVGSSSNLIATTYNITLSATQGGGTFGPISFSLVVTIANSFPTAITLNNVSSGTINVQIPSSNIGYTIGVLLVTMSDGSTYTGPNCTTGGSSGGRFAVSGQGVTVTGSNLTAGSYQVNFTASENGTFTSATFTVAVTIATGLTAVLTTTSTTPYHTSGATLTYTESTGTYLGAYLDPQGRYVVNKVRCPAPAGYDIEVDFARYTGSGLLHLGVEMQRSTVTSANLNANNQIIQNTLFGPYTVAVSGDYTISGSTADHWDGSEWRVASWGPPRSWPFPLTPVSTLQSQGIVGTYDTVLGGNTISAPSPGGTLNTTLVYQPFQQTNGTSSTPGFVCNLRMSGAGTGVDDAIGLEGLTVSAYLAGFNSGATNMLPSLLEQADASHCYPWYRRDPSTGANINTVGSTGLYTQGQVPGAAGQSGFKSIQPFNTTVISVIWTNSTGSPIAVPATTTLVDNTTGYAYELPGSGTAVIVPANGTTTSNSKAEPNITTNGYFPRAGLTITPSITGLTAVWNSTDTTYNCEGCPCSEPEVNHLPNVGFIPFMLTGDPYHLGTVQAKACAGKAIGCLNWPIAHTGIQFASTDNFAIEAGRAWAWLCRDQAESVIATPAVVPSWFLPQSDFVYSLSQMKAAVVYRWANPPSAVLPGAPVVNFLASFASNGLLASPDYEDYFLLASVRALVADPTWATWLSTYVQNITQGRMGASSGWCNNVTMWFNGLDFSAATDWSDAFNIMLTSGLYPTLSGTCPASLIFHTSPLPNWNNGDMTWTYAAMTRLQQNGFGPAQSGWSAAYSFYVPAMHTFLAAQSPPGPAGWVWDWRWCFST